MKLLSFSGPSGPTASRAFARLPSRPTKGGSRQLRGVEDWMSRFFHPGVLVGLGSVKIFCQVVLNLMVASGLNFYEFLMVQNHF